MSKIRKSYDTELRERILCDSDPPDRQADAVYLVTEHDDNRESVFKRAVTLYREGWTEIFVLIDAATNTGYSGFDTWSLNLDISLQNIMRVRLPHSVNLNTLTESTAFVREAKKRNWRDVIQIAWGPVHQPRAFMTLVSEVLRAYPELKVYSKPGRTLAWGERVHHSQGTGPLTREEWIHEEEGRIRRYRAKGDLISAKKILAYMDWRDSVRIDSQV